MSNHSFQSSVILYRIGTLTLAQAARHAGCSEAAMAEAAAHPVRPAQGQSTDADGVATGRSIDA